MILTISFEDLIRDIEITDIRNGYGFYHVLNTHDRVQFLDELRLMHHIHLDIFKRKAIKLGDWVKIMKKINLTNLYVMFRPAYKGENEGNKTVNNINTNLVCEIMAFGNNYIQPPPGTNCILKIRYLFGYKKKKPVSIIFYKGRMRELEDGFMRSKWNNYEHGLWSDEYYG